MTPPHQKERLQQEFLPPPLASAWTQVQGYNQKQEHQTTKFRMEQKPLEWIPNFITDPPLPHSCPRLLRTTSDDFRPKTPLTGKRPDSSCFFLHQLCKGNSIIGVRTRQSLRDSGIQIRPIVMRPQMSTRRHMPRPMNLGQRRITPKNQQVILQKTQDQLQKQKGNPEKHSMIQNPT